VFLRPFCGTDFIVTEEIMETLNQRKRKAKGKWFGNSKKAKYSICPGQRGFLLFCNNREREAIKEARVLLMNTDLNS